MQTIDDVINNALIERKQSSFIGLDADFKLPPHLSESRRRFRKFRP